MAHDEDLMTTSFETLSRFFVGEQTLSETLDQVAHLATATIDNADMAGLTLVAEGRPGTPVHTHSDVVDIDQAQYDTGDGPCIDAYRDNEVNLIESTETCERWRPFCDAALEKGVKSTISFPLNVAGTGIGALNFYSRRDAAFGDDDARLGLAFSNQAAVVLANARAYWGAMDLSDQLRQALTSRSVIDQAKGVLMAAEGCTADEAFDTLRRASQRSNRKLRDIAQEIIERAQQRGHSMSQL